MDSIKDNGFGYDFGLGHPLGFSVYEIVPIKSSVFLVSGRGGLNYSHFYSQYFFLNFLSLRSISQ